MKALFKWNANFWQSKVFWTNFVVLVLGVMFPAVGEWVQGHPSEAVYFWTVLNMVLRLFSKGAIEIK